MGSSDMNADASIHWSKRLRRNPWLAAGLSAIIPGLGHLALDLRRRALGLMAVDLVVASVLVTGLVWFRLELVKLWVIPAGLIAILAVNAVALVFRSLVVADTFSRAGGARLRTSGVVALAIIVFVLAAPHAVLGYVAYNQYDLVMTVFGSPEGGGGGSGASSTASTSPPTTGTGRVSTTTTLPPTTTTTTLPPFWDGLERLNVVLLGADAGVGRTGLRTDTTIVVSIDPITGDTAMFSVPRDLSDAPLPEGMGLWDCNCFPDLITHLYDAGVRYPDAFPGPGDAPINAIKGALGEIFGIEIHYYALVTLQGFVAMVDALGGVDIDVPARIVDETYPHEDGTTEHVVIEEGFQHLDGHLALAYSRIRRHADDFARMHRQRCVLEAIVEQTGPIDVIARFGALTSAAKDHLMTDIPRDRLVDFVDLIPLIDPERIATLRITRTEYRTGSAPGRVYYDIDRIRADAQQLMTDPVAAQERLGLDALDATCAESFD